MIEQTYKVVTFGDDAKEKVRAGVRQLTDAVKVTMGPSGHNVLIEQPGSPPVLTKDGVTVARAINLKDKFANLSLGHWPTLESLVEKHFHEWKRVILRLEQRERFNKALCF